MLASTADRVTQNTFEATNEMIRRQTEANVRHYTAQGPQAIERRLAELDQEWDIERCLETMAPTITLLGLTLGLTGSRKWLILPILVQTFFLQHALQGWCPPLPILRQLGIRTVAEIDEERYALKATRGDFKEVSQPDRNDLRTERALEAVHSRTAHQPAHRQIRSASSR
jgi:hypothetical protein